MVHCAVAELCIGQGARCKAQQGHRVQKTTTFVGVSIGCLIGCFGGPSGCIGAALWGLGSGLCMC